MANVKELFENHVFKSPQSQTEFLIAESREYLDPHATALDIGCGSGDYLAELLEEYLIERGTGIDLSSNNIKKAAEDFVTPRLEFIEGDYFKTVFKKPFGTIVSNSALQYQKVSLEKINQDLAPQGTLILYTPTFSLKNIFKNSLRFILSLVPKSILEPLALFVMKALYSDEWGEEDLKERLVYLCAKAYFMMGKKELRKLDALGLKLKKALYFKKVSSFWKLSHGFFVFRKI